MILAALLIAAQAVPQPADLRTFRDWTVACDNGRRCQASSLMPEGADFSQAATLFVERGPEAAAVPMFRLVNLDGSPARLAIGGAAVAARISPVDGDHAIVPRDPGAFLRALQAGDRIEVQDAGGRTIGAASLAGLTATLLYMDERQGRLGTVTALVRPGARQATAVPPPPPLPQVRLAPATTERPIAIPAARIAQLRREAGCAINDVGGPDEVETGALGGGRTLVLLACGSGAYNITHTVFVARRVGRRIAIDPARFDAPTDGMGESGGPALVNAGWDAQARRLGAFAKGRGLGDCGVGSTFGWDGARFRLLEQVEMGECRGSIAYLTTWRAQAR